MGIDSYILACTKNNKNLCVSATFDLCNCQKTGNKENSIQISIIEKIMLCNERYIVMILLHSHTNRKRR